jgi:hypothetical protein
MVLRKSGPIFSPAIPDQQTMQQGITAGLISQGIGSATYLISDLWG